MERLTKKLTEWIQKKEQIHPSLGQGGIRAETCEFQLASTTGRSQSNMSTPVRKRWTRLKGVIHSQCTVRPSKPK